MGVIELLSSLICTFNYIIYQNTDYTSFKTHPFRITKNQLVAFSEIMSVSFEKVWNTTCGQTAVSFKGDFRFVPPYIRGLRSSEVLCGVGEKVVAEVSGLNPDPIFRVLRTACRFEKWSKSW